MSTESDRQERLDSSFGTGPDLADRDTAFTNFVAARHSHLRRIAYAVCGDWHQADDLLQTALIKLYVAWPRIRRESPGLSDHDPPAAAETPHEERSALFDALHSLPLQQRKVVVLRHWLGLSVRETARELEISEGTVKSHSSRGLARLEASLTEDAGPRATT